MSVLPKLKVNDVQDLVPKSANGDLKMAIRTSGLNFGSNDLAKGSAL